MDNININKSLFDNARAITYEDRAVEYNFNTVPFEWHLEKAKQLIPEGVKVIDIGCGTGELIRNLSKHVNSHFLGVDLSGHMIAQAKKEAKETKNITFDVMSALDLKIADEAYDIAIMRGALHHFHNPERSLSEAFRVLKENGQLHILDILSY